jgi:V-type H+-transporting ATPase subunit d
MIDNIVLLITGTLHERDTVELLEKCHPLGVFKSMASLSVAHSVADLYNSVLIDTPLGNSSSFFCCLLFCFYYTGLVGR